MYFQIKHHHHHIKIPVPVPVPIHVDHHNHLDGGLPYGPPSGGGYDYPPYPPHSPHHTSGRYHLPTLSRRISIIFKVSSFFFFYKASGSDYKDYDSTGSGGGGSGYGNDYGSVTHFGDNEAHLSSWGLGSNIHEAGVLDAKNQPIYVSFILSLSLSFYKAEDKKILIFFTV